MQDSNLLMYLVGEAAAILLAVCIFLCFHVKGLKKLISRLEEKILDLRKSVTLAKKETKNTQKKLAAKNKIKPKLFLDYIDEEVELTLDHHKSLNPDRDIVLDIAPDAPIERQAASLRHAFLLAEKEARHAGEETVSNWGVLQAKFQQIIQFFQSAAPAQEDEEDYLERDDDDDENVSEDSELIENYKKQIENLERFKSLFFATDDKWRNAKKQAEEYHRLLLEKTNGMSDDGEINMLLENYAQAYDEVGNFINEAVAAGGDVSAARHTHSVIEAGGSGVGKMVVANQEEMQRLRNMAVDQHKVITELKRQLVGAKTPEEQQEIVDQLTVQLEQQDRFIKEAETCTQLIEGELNRVMEENETLRQQLESGGSKDAEGASEDDVKELESVVEDLTAQSKDMLRTIAALEENNQSLKAQIESGGGSDLQENNNLLKEKLSEMQQELLNLQTQHIELEERYLELKMEGG